MKIFVAHATNSNFREELYKPLRNSPLNKNHVFILPQENEKEKVTKDLIARCDLLLAEVSYPSTGQGIELGWADAANVPIVCIVKKGSTYSKALQYVCKQFVEYSNPENMIKELTHILKKL